MDLGTIVTAVADALRPSAQAKSVTLEVQQLAAHGTVIGDPDSPPEFLPRVFERFAQADSTTTRAHSGVGLGLAIVNELIELHGGSVEGSRIARSAARSEGVNKGHLSKPVRIGDLQAAVAALAAAGA